MTTLPPAQLASRYRHLKWASVLYLVPGIFVLLANDVISVLGDSTTFVSPLNRLGLSLLAAGLLVPATLEALRRFSPDWRAALDTRAARVVRHPRWLRLAQWWCASMGALVFALLAFAPSLLDDWLGLGSPHAPLYELPLLAYLFLSAVIASAPLLLLGRFDRPR
jgi:hypothetical protein